MTGPIVTVFNRTSRRLVVTKDGKETVLEPGINHITQDLVLYAKQQHPMPGTEDPNTLDYESLVSYVADRKKGEKQRDSLEEISDEILALLPKERINRMLLPLDRQNVEETPNVFPRGRLAVEAVTSGMIDPGSFDK